MRSDTAAAATRTPLMADSFLLRLGLPSREERMPSRVPVATVAIGVTLPL
jgi:hypothetical protein